MKRWIFLGNPMVGALVILLSIVAPQSSDGQIVFPWQLEDASADFVYCIESANAGIAVGKAIRFQQAAGVDYRMIDLGQLSVASQGMAAAPQDVSDRVRQQARFQSLSMPVLEGLIGVQQPADSDVETFVNSIHELCPGKGFLAAIAHAGQAGVSWCFGFEAGKKHDWTAFFESHPEVFSISREDGINFHSDKFGILHVFVFKGSVYGASSIDSAKWLWTRLSNRDKLAPNRLDARIRSELDLSKESVRTPDMRFVCRLDADDRESVHSNRLNGLLGFGGDVYIELDSNHAPILTVKHVDIMEVPSEIEWPQLIAANAVTSHHLDLPWLEQMDRFSVFDTKITEAIVETKPARSDPLDVRFAIQEYVNMANYLSTPVVSRLSVFGGEEARQLGFFTNSLDEVKVLPGHPVLFAEATRTINGKKTPLFGFAFPESVLLDNNSKFVSNDESWTSKQIFQAGADASNPDIWSASMKTFGDQIGCLVCTNVEVDIESEFLNVPSRLDVHAARKLLENQHKTPVAVSVESGNSFGIGRHLGCRSDFLFVPQTIENERSVFDTIRSILTRFSSGSRLHTRVTQIFRPESEGVLHSSRTVILAGREPDGK